MALAMSAPPLPLAIPLAPRHRAGMSKAPQETPELYALLAAMCADAAAARAEAAAMRADMARLKETMDHCLATAERALAELCAMNTKAGWLG